MLDPVGCQIDLRPDLTFADPEAEQEVDPHTNQDYGRQHPADSPLGACEEECAHRCLCVLVRLSGSVAAGLADAVRTLGLLASGVRTNRRTLDDGSSVDGEDTIGH